jgi:hypothetical protein
VLYTLDMHDGHETSPAPLQPNKPRKKGIYILPNLFTLGGLFGGFYAVVMAMNGRFSEAAIGVFCAMVLDSLDGRVARMTNTQSAFGEQMDSLSDSLRMVTQRPGPLGLDSIVRLLCLRCAALGTFQCEYRRGGQALLSGLAQPCGGGFGRWFYMADD